MPRFDLVERVGAFGRREAACVTAAAALLGGHARVGFENKTLMLPTGARAASNAELVGAAMPAACKRSGLRPRPQKA